MAIPQNKLELIKEINNSFLKLHNDYGTLTKEQVLIEEIEGNIKNTKISVKDTLSYLIGWLELVNIWIDNKDEIVTLTLPHQNYKWNELGLLAKSFYKKFENEDFISLLKKHKELNKSILEKLAHLTNEELYEKTWYKNYPLGRMIQFNTSSPNKNVRTKIKRFIKNVKNY
ncbi:ClbS/DfsB family four-helix bundle protein [Malaciobacter canalis]|uniref:ClbS/DfsB family four-helix bundle protein n=1 Tax=Malaciobacter canalis TaxID=1912871 RepID=UPI00384B4D5A